MAQSSNADEEKQVAQLLELARSMEDAREWQYLPLRVEQGVNVLLNSNLPKEARDLARKVVAFGYSRSNDVYKQVDFAASLEMINELIALDAMQADYHWLCGLYHAMRSEYQMKSEWDEAIAAYDRALKIDPGCAAYYYSRGVSYSWKYGHDRAIADYDRAIALEPNVAQYYLSRGAGYIWKQAYDLAVADYDRAIALNPNVADYYFVRSMSYESRNLRQALADINIAIQMEPEVEKYYICRSRIYLRLGHGDNARADYNHAYELNPNNDALEDLYFSIKFTF